MKSPPLLVLFTLFFVGIILERIINLPSAALFFLVLIMVFGVFWLWRTKKYFIFVFSILFLLLGMLRLSFVVNLSPQNVANLKDGSQVNIIGKIISRPVVSRYGSTNFILKVKHERKNGKLIKRTGNVKVSCKGILKNFHLGELVKVKGIVADFAKKTNPVGFSLKEYNFSQGIYKKLFVLPQHVKLLKKSKLPLLNNLVFKLQAVIKTRINRFMPGYQDLLGSMLLGSRVVGLDKTIKERYKRAGVAHLLVASGMHLGIIVGSFAVLLASFKLSPRTSFVVLTILNCFYFLLAGAGTSIARASVMLELALISKLFNRDRDFLVSICFAAFLVLLRSPLDLFSVAFQLSFGATVGVVCVTPMLEKNLFNGLPLPNWIIKLFAIALAPLLLTYPICAYHFNQISIVAFCTNLVVLPLIAGLIVFAAVTLIISFILLPVSKILGFGVFAGMFLLDKFVELISKISFASINIAGVNLLVLILWYGLMYLVFKVLVARGKQAAFFAIAVCLLFFLIFSGFSVNRYLEISFLDVGQGDSILINTPNGKNVLIDAGDVGYGKRVVLPVLQKKGVNKLDLIILTHPHMDHVGGIPEVMREIKVNTFSDPGVYHTAFAYRETLKLIKEKKIMYKVLKKGDHFALGEVNFYILGPPEEKIQSESYLNDNSVIIRVVYKDIAIILTGDAERAGEMAVIDFVGQAQILKVGHHGSATSSSWEFLRAVKPRVAVISCGKHNKFNHPHKAALDNLAKIGAQIFRTDLNGAVLIKTDGKKVLINTMKR